MPNYLNFNLSPSPTGGQGAFGSVPGQTGAPPSIYSQTQAAYPGLPGLTAGAGDVIGNELAGKLSPGTISNIDNAAAARGVALGQPNSDLSSMIDLSLMGTTSEGLQKQGEQDYLNFLSGVGSTQLNPSLLTDISQSNANLGSAPDPTAAANELLSLENSGVTSFTGAKYNPSGNVGGYPTTGASSPGAFNYFNETAQSPSGNPYSVYSFGAGAGNVDFSDLYS